MMDSDALAFVARARLLDPHVLVAIHVSLRELCDQFIDGLANVGNCVVLVDLIGEMGLKFTRPWLVLERIFLLEEFLLSLVKNRPLGLGDKRIFHILQRFLGVLFEQSFLSDLEADQGLKCQLTVEVLKEGLGEDDAVIHCPCIRLIHQLGTASLYLNDKTLGEEPIGWQKVTVVFWRVLQRHRDVAFTGERASLRMVVDFLPRSQLEVEAFAFDDIFSSSSELQVEYRTFEIISLLPAALAQGDRKWLVAVFPSPISGTAYDELLRKRVLCEPVVMLGLYSVQRQNEEH